MPFFWLKIFHIISAALMLTGMIYCFNLWKRAENPNDIATASQQIQFQTWLNIIPCALFQLMTGFTMISYAHYTYSQLWVTSSMIGFIVVMGTWFSFIYFLLLSQQLVTQSQNPQFLNIKFRFYRRIQSTFLLLCLITLLTMVFFMTTET